MKEEGCMKDDAFVAISKFCEDNKLSKLHQRILLHKYYEDYYILIEDYRKKENSNPSTDTIKGFNSTLLNEMTLKTNISLANDEIKNYTEKEIAKVKKNQFIKSFWFSVLSSIIGSFLFAILLLIIFTLAQNQVKSWINDLYNNGKQIEQTITNEQQIK